MMMKDVDLKDVLKALELHMTDDYSCYQCPYKDTRFCNQELGFDILYYISEGKLKLEEIKDDNGRDIVSDAEELG